MKLTFITSDRHGQISLFQAQTSSHAKALDPEEEWENFVHRNKDVLPVVLDHSLVGAIEGHINWIPAKEEEKDPNETRDYENAMARIRHAIGA